MQMKWFVGGILTLGACVAGCHPVPPAPRSVPAPQARVPATAAVEHFDPAPPVVRPRTPTVADLTGMAGGMGIGGNATAQTFTASAASVLTEVQVGSQRQLEASDAPLTLEIRRTIDGKPRNDRGSVLYHGLIPLSALPTAGRAEGGWIRVDVSAARIAVRKGEQLAIVQLPAPNGHIQVEIVNGRTYPGGDFYQMGDDGWQPDGLQSQLQFRVLAEAPTNNSTTTPTPRPPADLPDGNSHRPGLPLTASLIPSLELTTGQVIAECTPRPARPFVAQPRPPRQGRWQYRLHAFHDGSGWYAEFTSFNGTNEPGGFGGYEAISATVSRIGEPTGRVVYPVRNGMMTPYPRGMASAGPGEGIVRQFRLSEESGPLAPGRYIVTVSVIPRPGDNAHTVVTEFDVP